MFRKLWEYNNWANELVLNSMSENLSLLPGSSILLISHIVNAQTIWADRLHGRVPELGVWDLHDLDYCKILHENSSVALRSFLDQCLSMKLINYKTSTGAEFSTSVCDILTHTFNHATYHRAQIASQLKEAGVTPVTTDYILFARI
ncbi:DinB family protein [Pedobacter sp. PWIIR3]